MEKRGPTMQHAYMYRDADNRVIVVERTPKAFDRVPRLQDLTPMFEGRPVPRLIIDAFLRQFGGVHVTGYGTQPITPDESEPVDTAASRQ